MAKEVYLRQEGDIVKIVAGLKNDALKICISNCRGGCPKSAGTTPTTEARCFGMDVGGRVNYAYLSSDFGDLTIEEVQEFSTSALCQPSLDKYDFSLHEQTRLRRAELKKKITDQIDAEFNSPWKRLARFLGIN